MRTILARALLVFAFGVLVQPLCLAADLSGAAVWMPAPSPLERKAAGLLIDEVEARTGIRWTVSQTLDAGAGPVIAAGTRAALKTAVPELSRVLASPYDAAEGFELVTATVRGRSAVVVAGNDPHGVLYGIGRLLRTLEMTRGNVALPAALNIRTAPHYRLRGHQLGYRPKTNSYDGWTVPMWEQYIRDLAVFGTNAIELIPPRSDDAADSPHFPLPPIRMMREMSRLADEYGMECWVWYPAMDRDYSTPETVASAITEWAGVLGQLPRVDAVFVPGGDPGHTQPRYLMALLEKQAASLRKLHPRVQMWVSPQSFNAEWMDEFLAILKTEPSWLAGIVYGPQTRMSVRELRAKVPARYPIRLYPDITHTLRSQFPVPDWDVAYALTLNREPIDPRPLDEVRIFRLIQPDAAHGFLTYSEGCNDDVNKIVWSSLGWDPERNVAGILREYSRYFLGPDMAEPVAQGLLALERNWRGPLATNSGVDVTLQQFRDLERRASPQQRLNWRFQEALYRAYYDAYVRQRLIAETAQEQAALACLRKARQTGAAAAFDSAEAALRRDPQNGPAADLRSRVFELAEALFQSVRMQLSVERYKAISVGRGANLDLVDTPLNNGPWLMRRISEARALDSEAERLGAIESMLNWTSPGPGGFYDDLGDTTNQPHLVRGEGFNNDPAFLKSALLGFASRTGMAAARMSWMRHAEALNDEPLEMAYHDLDRTAQYRMRVVYGGDMMPTPIRLVANGKFEVHPLRPKPPGFVPLEFDIPKEATAGGELRLTWTKPAGLGGNGRGVQVCEVWLMRKDAR